MKKILCYSSVLFCLFLLLCLAGVFSINAQTPFAVSSAKKSTAKNLWKLAAAKRSAQSFIVLTPSDLTKLAASEKASLLTFGDPCGTATEISIGQTVGGNLSAADCRLEDGTYADFYVFQGNQGQIIDLRLDSSAFDAYLGLANESGTFVLEDDDNGGGTNARIVATLPETGLYVVLANSVFPEETGAYSLSLKEIINCTYTLTPTSAEIPAAGGTFSITITTQNGCQWTARTNNEDFITVNTASGSGTANISYTVAPNGSGLSRGGFLVINNNLTFTIQQPTLQCNFVLTPSSANFPIAGGSGSINITVQEGCTWRAISNSSFITTSGSGSGNGTVNYTVAANPGVERGGSITIGASAPVFFYITQAGMNCATNVSPREIYAGKTGRTGTVFVNTNCAWTIGAISPFIEISAASGSGSGTFNYTVLANNTGSNRSGIIRLGDGQNTYTIFVEQIGAISTARFDFTRDGKADAAVFRPSANAWYIRQNQQVLSGIIFGAATDKIVPADYDGDGITDVAVFRPSTGMWFFYNVQGLTSIFFGGEGDIPVPADYDGDGFADIAVFRPSSGFWYIRKSSDEQYIIRQFGAAEDAPTIGDFDGDGKSDIAVWRPSDGIWYRLNSSDDSFFASQFGAGEDKPTPADFDGDGKTDIAVWRPSDGIWYRVNSTDNSFTAVPFGASDDVPVPADYDGDKKADVAVFRPSDGNWYVLNSTTGFSAINFGMQGDLPIQNAFIR